MDAKKVRIILQAIKAGSMMKIAEDLGYTPSAVVHIMDAFEQDLGVKLIQRGHYGIRLTKEGENILPFLTNFLDAEQTIRNAVDKIKAGRHELIRFAAYTSVAKNWIPPLVSDFKKEYPDADIEFDELGHPDAYKALIAGEVDFIFTCHDAKYNCEFIPLHKDRFFAVLPANSSFANPDDVFFPLKRFDGVPFIMPSFGKDDDVKRVLKINDVHVKLVSMGANDQVIISMVANGLGVSILSELVLRNHKERIVTLPVRPNATENWASP
jgi:DNA-binding transcriptional LysR family regulator